jgi:hypothetical protein
MSSLGFLVAVALCAALGSAIVGWLAREEDGLADRVVLAGAGGMVGLHVWLSLLQAVGLRWTPVTILAAIVPAVAARWLSPRPGAWRRSRPGWPDIVTVLAGAAFAVAALRLWIVFPDFVFHWGVKGERYALRGGVDWEFLSRAWNWRSHPDYPQLLPELFAVTAILGEWRERAMMAWSIVHGALVILAARGAMAAGGVAEWPRRVATAALAALIAAYGIGNLMAGSADWLIALAILAALPGLFGPPSAQADLRLSLCAALAAAAKIEGVPLAALLVGLSLARRAVRERRLPLPALGRTALLPVLVAGWWWLGCSRHQLFQPFNTGAFDPGRAGEVLRAVLAVLAAPGAVGGPLLLLGLPVLLAVRDLRPVALALAGQLAFYLYVYMSAPIDPQFSVQSTFARLAFHLWPAVAVALVIASERLVGRAESCDPSAP